MDYNMIREGITVYLPVHQEGALLFVGGGHAAQRDGELTGNTLETSMDVEFTVNLISNQSTSGPRAEDDELITAMGVGVFHRCAAAVVLGTSMRYDVAEIVDPQVDVVAKVSKKVLTQLAR